MMPVRFVRIVFAGVSGLFCALGLALLLWPETAAGLCVLLGAAVIACGAVKLMGYFSDDLYRLAFQFDLAAGLLTIVVGLLLLLRPWDVLALLPVLLGLFILADSVLRLQTSIDARHFGMKKWWLLLLFSVCGAALGTALLLRPFQSTRALVRLTGLTLAADGAENLLAGLYTIKVPRRSGPGERDLSEKHVR